MAEICVGDLVSQVLVVSAAGGGCALFAYDLITDQKTLYYTIIGCLPKHLHQHPNDTAN